MVIKSGREKGKRRKKKGSKKGLKPVSDGLHPSEMSRGQLMFHIKRLMTEIEMEITERNLFMLERQKLLAYWNLCMDKIILLKDESSKFTTQLDHAKKGKDAENSYQSKKLRHLQNEENKNLGVIRLTHLNNMRHVSDEIWEIENILRSSAVVKRQQIRKMIQSQYEILRGLHVKHAQNLQQMILTMSHSMRSKEIFLDRRWESRKENSTIQLTKENQTRWIKKMENLTQQYTGHDKIVLDLKTYFNDMMVNNFAVISSLEEEVDRQKLENNRLKRNLRFSKKEFRDITQTLEKIQEELSQMNKKNVVTTAEDDDEGDGGTQLIKNLLSRWHHSRNVLKKREKCVTNLEILNEILIQRIDQALLNRTKVAKEYRKGVIHVQKQLCMENIVNNLKLKAAQRDSNLLTAIKSSIQKGQVVDVSTTKLKKIQCQQQKQPGHNVMEENGKLLKNVQEVEKVTEFDCMRQVNDNFRLASIGLVNKEGTISTSYHHHQHHERNDMCQKYVGLAQGIRSNIEYRGSLPNINEQLSRKSVKNIQTVSSSTDPPRHVGYGFYYEKPPSCIYRK